MGRVRQESLDLRVYRMTVALESGIRAGRIDQSD